MSLTAGMKFRFHKIKTILRDLKWLVNNLFWKIENKEYFDKTLKWYFTHAKTVQENIDRVEKNKFTLEDYFKKSNDLFHLVNLPMRQLQDLYVIPSNETSRASAKKIKNFDLSGKPFVWDIDDFTLMLRGEENQIKNRYLSRFHNLILKDLIPKNFGSSLIDLGCGNGKITSIIVNEFKEIKKVVGFDTVSINFENTVKKISSADCEVQFKQLSVLDSLKNDFDFKSDSIVMIQVMEHLTAKERIQVLPLLLQRITQNGFIYFEFPNILNQSVRNDTFWMDPEHTRPVSIRLIIEALNMLPCSYEWGVYTVDDKVILAKDYFSRVHSFIETEYMDLFFVIKQQPDLSKN